MKKIAIAVFAVAVCAVVAGVAWRVWSTAGAGEPKLSGRTIVLMTSADTPPYAYQDPKTGEIVGIEIDIAREAVAKLGCTLEVRKENFSDLLPLVGFGKADLAASGITTTEGRRQAVDFTVPHATDGGIFLYRAGDRMPTMISAAMMRVATVDASTCDFYLAYHDIESIRYDSFSMAVADLKAKRVDAVFADGSAVRAVASASRGELAASRVETREHLGIAVRKGDVRLKAALDEVIAARRAK